jgi:hypothetical protein
VDAEQERARRIHASIRWILLHDWDPIGVKDAPEAADEYDAYVGRVYRLLISRATDEEITRTLLDIENREMGLDAPGSLERARCVARALRTVRADLS